MWLHNDQKGVRGSASRMRSNDGERNGIGWGSVWRRTAENFKGIAPETVHSGAFSYDFRLSRGV